MTRTIVAAILSFFLVLPALAQAPNAAQPTPDDRARQWLTLVDDSNFAAAAAQMAPQARKDDIGALPALRQPLGAMSGRDLKQITLARTVKGLPDGQYAVINYESRFAGRMGVVETVTLAMTKGAWAVVRYRVE